MLYEKSCGAVIYFENDGRRLYLIELMQKGHRSICKGHVECVFDVKETGLTGPVLTVYHFVR